MNSAQQIWPIFRNVYPKALLNVIINKLISAPDVSMACLFLSSDDIQEMSERSERICGFFFSMKMLATSCFWRLVFNFYGYYSFYLSSLKIHTRRKMSNDFFNHHIPHTHTHTLQTQRDRDMHTHKHTKFEQISIQWAVTWFIHQISKWKFQSTSLQCLTHLLFEYVEFF